MGLRMRTEQAWCGSTIHKWDGMSKPRRYFCYGDHLSSTDSLDKIWLAVHTYDIGSWFLFCFMYTEHLDRYRWLPVVELLRLSLIPRDFAASFLSYNGLRCGHGRTLHGMTEVVLWLPRVLIVLGS